MGWRHPESTRGLDILSRHGDCRNRGTLVFPDLGLEVVDPRLEALDFIPQAHGLGPVTHGVVPGVVNFDPGLSVGQASALVERTHKAAVLMEGRLIEMHIIIVTSVTTLAVRNASAD